jgi:DNA-binding response OmpR family regulator
MAALRPHLVITDLVMKTPDAGFSFARRVREVPQFCGVRVIIVTSVTSAMGMDFRPRTPEDLAAMHADAYFDKPVAPRALLAKMEELLKWSRFCASGSPEPPRGLPRKSRSSPVVIAFRRPVRVKIGKMIGPSEVRIT